jgi:hypothetical protein
VKTYTTRLAGYCGVDSGQILFIDPCYVWTDDFIPGSNPTGGDYDTACRITLGKGYGEAGGGVVTGTAYGDGTYPVYVEMNSEGRVQRATIVFEEDEEDEQED